MRNTANRNRHRRAVAKTKPPCWICGKPIDYTLRTPHPGSFEIEHVIAIHNGGADDLTNIKASHRDCNNRKRAKPHADTIKHSGSLRRPSAAAKAGEGQGRAK